MSTTNKWGIAKIHSETRIQKLSLSLSLPLFIHISLDCANLKLEIYFLESRENTLIIFASQFVLAIQNIHTIRLFLDDLSAQCLQTTTTTTTNVAGRPSNTTSSTLLTLAVINWIVWQLSCCSLSVNY